MYHQNLSHKTLGALVTLLIVALVTTACGGAKTPEAAVPTVEQGAEMEATSVTVEETDTAQIEAEATVAATPTVEQGAQMEATAVAVEETDTAQTEAEATVAATAEAPDETGLPPVDETEWVIAGENIWIPVVDELGMHLQAARQDFLEQTTAGGTFDTKSAATEVRAGATFLIDKAKALPSGAGKTALDEAAQKLENLASELDKGQVTSIEALDEVIAEVYQVDVAHRLVTAKEETLFPLAEKPAQHFQYAIEALNKEAYPAAAAEIRQAAAYLKINEARAQGQIQEALQGVIGELNQVADDVAQGKITSAADLELAFAQAHYILAVHYQLAATDSESRDALRDAGYELKAAATNLEQTLFHFGQEASTEDAAFINNLRSLGDDLIAGKDVKGIYEELEARQAQAVSPAAPEEAWVVAEEDVWIPVVDELGQHLQAARSSFDAGDMGSAAEEIRAGAAFLENEAGQITNTADANALQDAAKNLDDLATKLEEGQVNSVDALNIAFQEAHQTDVAHRLRLTKEEAIFPLVERPAQHFQQAIEAFDKSDTAAAREIRQAIAYLQLSEARSVGPAKAALQASIEELTTLAEAVANGEIASPGQMDALAFARAHYALAIHHQLAAMGAEELGEMKDAGYELKAAATHLEQTLTRAGQAPTEEDTSFLENLRSLGDDLIAGKQIGSIAEELQQRQPAPTPEAEPQGQAASAPQDEAWLSITEENIWFPVVDEFGQELLTTRDEFLNGNTEAAAAAMRQAAQFLQHEELGPGTNPADIDARLEAAVRLVKLADDVEQGQVTDIAQLNPAFIEAYQVNIDHRLAPVPADERQSLGNQATAHFHSAVEAYAQGDNKLAATEIRKGVAYLRLDQALSNEAAKEAIQTSIDELNVLADEAAQGNVSPAELKEGIAGSRYELAAAYQQQAAEQMAAGDNSTSGNALKASVRHMTDALTLNGQKLEEDATILLNDINSLADKLVAGAAGHDIDHAVQSIEKLGQEIGKYAHEARQRIEQQ